MVLYTRYPSSYASKYSNGSDFVILYDKRSALEMALIIQSWCKPTHCWPCSRSLWYATKAGGCVHFRKAIRAHNTPLSTYCLIGNDLLCTWHQVLSITSSTGCSTCFLTHLLWVHMTLSPIRLRWCLWFPNLLFDSERYIFGMIWYITPR